MCQCVLQRVVLSCSVLQFVLQCVASDLQYAAAGVAAACSVVQQSPWCVHYNQIHNERGLFFVCVLQCVLQCVFIAMCVAVCCCVLECGDLQ